MKPIKAERFNVRKYSLVLIMSQEFRVKVIVFISIKSPKPHFSHGGCGEEKFK